MTMNQKSKNLWIDRFTQLLDDSNAPKIAREYSRVLNTIQKEAISMLEKQGNLTRGDIRNIIKTNPINKDVYKQALIKDYIASGVTLLIENPNPTGSDLVQLAPIIALVKGTRMNPVRIVNRIEQWSAQILRKGEPVGKFKGSIITLKEYVGTTNAKQIRNIASEWNKHVTELNRRITTNLSRDMFTDLRKFQKSTTIFAEDGTRLKQRRPLTEAEVSNKLRAKYRNASARVERIIRTEVSAQNELVRQLDARLKGYTKKRWINEGDSKVRQSHKGQILQQRPEVNEEFILRNKQTGKTSKALYPKDPSLPVEERVNCRCTIAYSK